MNAALPQGVAESEDEGVWRRWADFLRRAPELTLEWHDEPTRARGWLVLNSLRGGAAGGGTRMRSGVTREETLYLAKSMELKFAFSGPEIGGGKSAIDFDPADPRKDEVLGRWFAAIAPYLRARYGTGGDLNVDQVSDVIPACRRLGLLHPQEGVLRGHLAADDARLPAILERLDRGVKLPVGGELGVAAGALNVADLVTGYGVARAVIHWHRLTGQRLFGSRILIEGWGAVGAPCALYLARAGARVVGIADRTHALVSGEGIDAAEVERLLAARGADKLLPADHPHAGDGDAFGSAPAEVFVAAACSGTIDGAVLERLAGQGVGLIACGANQPFAEAALGDTSVQRLADRRFRVLADFVANCGMARAFSYLMQDDAVLAPEAIFGAVDATIGGTLEELAARVAGRREGLLAGALDLALDRLDSDAAGAS